MWFNKNKEKGKAVIYIHNCIGCGNCVRKCRNDALGIYSIGNEQFAKLINPSNCTGCGKCQRVCEYDAIEISQLIPCQI